MKDGFLKHQELKGQPQDAVKLHEEIITLKTTLSKFVNGINNLNKLLGYCRSSIDKFGNEYKRKAYVHDEDKIVCYLCRKIGHMTSRCEDCPKMGSLNPFMTYTKGPKEIWIPKKRIFHVTNILDSRIWLLTTREERKVYVPMSDSLSWWNNHFWRK